MHSVIPHVQVAGTAGTGCRVETYVRSEVLTMPGLRDRVVALAVCTQAASAATTIALGNRHMNISTLHAPSSLPKFGGSMSATPMPSIPPKAGADDTCPPEIQLNQITIEAPTLPYRVYDDYDCGGGCGLARATGTPSSMPTVVLESKNYKALVYPKHGAKLASLVHKPSGKELLFNNPVFQPGALGRLNAWTSGGVEWNWPRHGHTVFTVAPLYVAEVETERGPLLRLYEFDREMNSTYQVDLFTTDEMAAFYVHVKLVNTMHHPIDGYWWTNIAVPLANTSRVLFPADYAAVSGGDHGLSCVRFPNFPDDPSTLGMNLASDWPDATTRTGVGSLGLDNTERFSSDHSYPSQYYKARENFIGMDSNRSVPRAFMGIVDTATGEGTLHCQTQEQIGRKYWAWGNDPTDLARLYFLSSCEGGATKTKCLGAYLETQSGVASTQDQFFTMPPNSSLEWTETFSPLRLPTSMVTGSYDMAVAAAEQVLNSTASTPGNAGVPLDTFLETDAWLRAQVDKPPSRVLHSGTAWGRLHQLQTGTALGQGQMHNAPWSDAERPFAELLVNGSFSDESLLAVAPTGFMVDPAWEAKLLASMANHGPTWLHHLHLCILQTQNGGNGTGHCKMSVSLRPNPMAFFLLGNIQQAVQLARQAVESTQHARPDPERAEVDLLRDLTVARIKQLQVLPDYAAVRKELTDLEHLPHAVAQRLLAVQPMRIAAIHVALHLDKDADKAIDLLLDKTLNRGWAVSTPLLVPLWRDAWTLKATRAKGAPLNLLEAIKNRREHPPPSMLNFGGAT